MLHAVNLRAVFRASRAAQRMEEGGAILNMASISSTVGVPGIVAYGAMKGGVVQLTKGLAVELAPYGIRVNAVAPGYVSTAMTEELWKDEEHRAEVTARIPLVSTSPAAALSTSARGFQDGSSSRQPPWRGERISCARPIFVLS
jgi:NAD(P)-dependent dehydrogenase (short-subunit alcohol dehydrogenase family)